MIKDVQKNCNKCNCIFASQGQNYALCLYTPLLITSFPREDISIDFILGLPKTQRGLDFIFLVMDRFNKIAHFIPYYKVDDVSYKENLFF